ncbi:DegV family protein [Carbonactinospora thermoautotrophica]|uniref:DegV family protein n=1 Tax=Carbonactinospora thermoautotrophica TaxID=1469144 RepID=UPI003DAA11A6
MTGASCCTWTRRVLLYVDTLEHLRRGGRIGRAQALLGAALAIKPLLSLEDGEIVPVDKVSGSNRALHRLEEIALKHVGDRPVDLAVEYFDTPDRAAALARRLRAKLPSVRATHVGIGSTTIGAHLGPGALGVTVSPVAP